MRYGLLQLLNKKNSHLEVCLLALKAAVPNDVAIQLFYLTEESEKLWEFLSTKIQIRVYLKRQKLFQILIREKHKMNYNLK